MKSVKSSYRRYRPLILTGCIAILLLTTSGGMSRKLSMLKIIAPVTSAQQDPAASAQQGKARRKALSLEERRAKLEKWLERLRVPFLTYSIPFPPEALASENWRKELAPAFESMPQMRETRTVGTYLAGVYIADTLILPEKTTVVADIFILANHLIFEGPNPHIGGGGVEGAIYVIPMKSDSVRRIKIDPTSDSPEEQTDGVSRYLRWVFREDSDLPIERDLPSTINLPKNAKNIRAIGNYVYFQLGSDNPMDK